MLQKRNQVLKLKKANVLCADVHDDFHNRLEGVLYRGTPSSTIRYRNETRYLKGCVVRTFSLPPITS